MRLSTGSIYGDSIFGYKTVGMFRDQSGKTILWTFLFECRVFRRSTKTYCLDAFN
ncbi:hypothetical protein Q4565_07510 [Leptospira santarosai]|nr:hypothetical protein [Leptospira santarosai]